MSAFVPLTVDEAVDYLRAAGLVPAGESARATELGGGVSSAVILVETAGRRLIAKQALPKLKVRADWPSRPDRSLVEVAAIAAYAPHLPPGAAPTVRHVDAGRHCFVMDAAPAGALNWKAELLAGRVEPAMAGRAGAILAGMHLGPGADPATAARFADTEFFETLRVDPYLWEVARAHPDLRPTIGEIVDDMSSHRRALVHGDYSPKNMLVHGDDLLVLDYEVAHWGDPAFDLAFCLNHFFLKAVYRPADGAAFCESARAFWAGYRPALALEGAATLLPRTLRLLGGLMLARIDGKSPVEYITEPAMQARVREIARRILRARPAELADVAGMVVTGA